MASERKSNTTFGSSFGLFNDPTHMDVTLVFGDTDNLIHRRVHKEMDDDTCKLEIGDNNSIEAMIRHIYGLAFNDILDESGNLIEHDCTEFLLEVYHVADHYQLDDLRDEVASKLASQSTSLWWGCKCKFLRFAEKFDKFSEHEATFENKPAHGFLAFFINHLKQLREQQDFRETVLDRMFPVDLLFEHFGISKFDKNRGLSVCSSCVEKKGKGYNFCVGCENDEEEGTSE
ncbi:hypothetical protein KCU71_g4335, partial [Aureobasidium melanogenum]